MPLDGEGGGFGMGRHILETMHSMEKIGIRLTLHDLHATYR